MKKFLRPPADSLRRGRVFRYDHAHVDVAAPALERGVGLVGGVGEHLRDLLGRVGDSDLKLDADEVPPKPLLRGTRSPTVESATSAPLREEL